MTRTVIAEPVVVTARCEAELHSGCRGQVLSFTGDRPCACSCHAADELAVEAILEAAHYADF